MKAFFNWKAFPVIPLFVMIVLMVMFAVSMMDDFCSAEEYVKGYVICQPGDYVYGREKASRKSEQIGYLETGDAIWTDGKSKNGYIHCVNSSFERDECWVYGGYIVFDEPKWMGGAIATVVSNGRLAARKNTTGDVRAWLKNGTEIQVFWYSNEWCVTNRGFVMTEYIELDGEG